MTEQHIVNFNEKPTACFGYLAEFEMKIREIAETVGVDLAEFEIDHLAVRVNTVEKAEVWKSSLLSENHANLLKESLVNGRPITLLDLHQPLTFCNQAVSIIELPFPKDKTYPTEGWEHIEIVVPMLAGETVEQWIERLCKRWDLVDNSQIKLKVSEPKVEGERLPNPSIAISLEKTFGNSCCLKLHPFSIRQIVESENLL